MCGIAGWVAKAEAVSGSLTLETMGHMLDAIAHRGPDDQGVYSFGGGLTGCHAVLGHRRLSIIDPNGARQPMVDGDTGLALSFNGEIYNFKELREELSALGYRFTRVSDTEVLLRAYQHWREDCVHHLRGMFAFAIWDARRERLFMARDRFGEKPLFVYEDGRGLFFASEIKALLRVPGIGARVDLPAVWDYLAYRYVPGPRTLFEGVRKLPPGTCATWEAGRLTQKRYWSPPDRRARLVARLPEDVVGAFFGHLEEAVERQMVSDVPFGAFLSGGIDSSVIVGLMSRHNSLVKTFSVGFGDDKYSELAYAAEVAAHFRTDHHEIVVDHKDLMARLPALVGFRDAPVSEPSDIPIHMLATEAARSVKMVLTGEGSDELLGGYPKHVFERFAGGFQAVPGYVRRGLIAPLAKALPYGYRRVKTAVANLNIEDRRERYARWFGALDHTERERLSVLRFERAGPNGADAPPFDSEPNNSALRRILYFDQTSWLPDNLLERGDRMTMAASIESRVPFLDHRLAEFVSTLPDELRVRGMKTKWILRESARKLIPERILSRPKVGFRVPVNEWFRNGMRDYLVDHLKGGGSVTRDYYDRKALDVVLADHIKGRHNHEKLLWSLLNLEIWHRQYVGQ
jgi:asparagine synthase (glutamine-hydrolysing)